MTARMKLVRIATVTALSTRALVAACFRAEEPARPANPITVAASAASQPATVITDFAHWQHPTKAVFAKYKVTLKSVTVLDRHATVEVAFPFDPQTEPNAARLQAPCLELLKANSSWSYALVSHEGHIEIDASWNAQTRKIAIDNHAV
jgi:hypothetical protein